MLIEKGIYHFTAGTEHKKENSTILSNMTDEVYNKTYNENGVDSVIHTESPEESMKNTVTINESKGMLNSTEASIVAVSLLETACM